MRKIGGFEPPFATEYVDKTNYDNFGVKISATDVNLLGNDLKTDVPCHSRCGMLKNPLLMSRKGKNLQLSIGNGDGSILVEKFNINDINILSIHNSSLKIFLGSVLCLIFLKKTENFKHKCFFSISIFYAFS